MRAVVLLAVILITLPAFAGSKMFQPVKPNCRTVCTTNGNQTICVTQCN